MTRGEVTWGVRCSVAILGEEYRFQSYNPLAQSQSLRFKHEMVGTNPQESAPEPAPFNPDGVVHHSVAVYLLRAGQRARGGEPDPGRQRFLLTHRMS
jgi:hypothetical protein